MSEGTAIFTKEVVKKYLDDCIVFWRKERDSGGEDTVMYEYYIDAYQSVRASLFNKTLPLDDMLPEDFLIPSMPKGLNMIRIGNTIIDKDRVEYVELGTENDPEEVEVMMQVGRRFRWWEKEAIEVRKFLIKQFPCEDQTLWLENST